MVYMRWRAGARTDADCDTDQGVTNIMESDTAIISNTVRPNTQRWRQKIIIKYQKMLQ